MRNSIWAPGAHFGDKPFAMELAAAVLAVGLTVAAFGGGDSSDRDTGTKLRDRFAQMRDGGQMMIDNGYCL